MSGIKDYAHHLRKGVEDPHSALDKIAKALGGEAAGRTKIIAPSPGCDPDDRSMVVFFNNPNQQEQFYIYNCEGSLREARVDIAKRLADVPDYLRCWRGPLGSESIHNEDVAPDVAERTAVAMKIWRQTTPATGTIVQAYLRSRAITLPVPERIRFHGALKHGPTGGRWPAMVALVTDAADSPVAIHRTYLTPNGKDKAPVEPNRMSLGPIRGSAIRLASTTADLVVGEGIETCLSGMMAGRPAWAAGSAMGLRTLVVPDEVRALTILVDGDDAGERAACEAAARWERQGRRVLLCRAPLGKDFNDLLMDQS